MKKSFAILFSLLLLLNLTSCLGGSGADEEDTAEMTIEEKYEASFLLYPAFNDNFQYDVYDHYVAITSYIGSSDNVVIPDKIDGRDVLVIDAGAFPGDYNDEEYKGPRIKSVKLPSSLLRIEDSAFSGLSCLGSISFPETLQTIADDAFSDCYSLKEVTIPESVNYIGAQAFANCSKLASVTIEQQIPTEVLNEEYDINPVEDNEEGRMIGESCFKGCSRLTAAWVPADIFAVGSNAFSLSESPNLVVYGDGKTRIAYFASECLLKFVVLDKEKFDQLAEEVVQKAVAEEQSSTGASQTATATATSANNASSPAKQ